MFCFVPDPSGVVWSPVGFDEAIVRDDSVIASTITEAKDAVGVRTGLVASAFRTYLSDPVRGPVASDVIIAFDQPIHALDSDRSALVGEVEREGVAFVFCQSYSVNPRRGYPGLMARLVLPVVGSSDGVYKVTRSVQSNRPPRLTLSWTRAWGMVSKLMGSLGHESDTRHSSYHPVTRALMLERLVTWLGLSDFRVGNRVTNAVLAAEIADYRAHRGEYLREFFTKHPTNSVAVLGLVAAIDKRFAPRLHAKDERFKVKDVAVA